MSSGTILTFSSPPGPCVRGPLCLIHTALPDLCGQGAEQMASCELRVSTAAWRVRGESAAYLLLAQGLARLGRVIGTDLSCVGLGRAFTAA